MAFFGQYSMQKQQPLQRSWPISIEPIGTFIAFIILRLGLSMYPIHVCSVKTFC